jgi:hypothetical protein
MKILVIDKLFQTRSGRAETDMYKAMMERHNLVFDISLLYSGDYDVLWLGAYHFRMGLDIQQILSINKKPVFVLQADNEEFAKEPFYKDVTVLCRYLPSDALSHYKTELLPWYMEPIEPQEKTCDVAFICSMYGDRVYQAKVIKKVCEDNGWTSVTGEYHEDYLDLISRCRVMVIQCDRQCLTLKYLEASYCDMPIVGTVPVYPENKFKVIEADLGSHESVKDGIEKALKSKSNIGLMENYSKEKFLTRVDEILNKK